jgi:hypothetical protein
VKQRGGTVILACPRVLRGLLTTCPGIDQIIVQGSLLPDFDCYVPLLSLPRLFGTTATNIPANVPYLSADPDLVQHWRRDLAAYEGVKIGVAWQGSPKYTADRLRSFPLARLEPLARVPGVQLFSLQKGPGTEQLATAGFPVIDLASRLDERTGPFQDTAAVLRCLDLVVAPDTAVAHLAGALAAPVWLALSYAPHWVWGRNGDHSMWYPCMRLFRQAQPTDWDGVFRQMATDLARGEQGVATGSNA